MDIKHSLSLSGCDTVALRMVPYPLEREIFEKRECSMWSVLRSASVDVSVIIGSVRTERDRADESSISVGLTSIDERVRCPYVTVNSAIL